MTRFDFFPLGRKNVLKLNVYFDSLEYTTIYQDKAYDVSHWKDSEICFELQEASFNIIGMFERVSNTAHSISQQKSVVGGRMVY